MLLRFVDILNGAIVPLLIVLIVFGVMKKAGGRKTLRVALFTLYLAAVLDVVGVPSIQVWSVNPSFAPTFNLIPFSDLFKEHFSPNAVFQFAANIVLFIPFGLFLPWIWGGFRTFCPTAIAGALMSFCLEFSQLFSLRVVAADDLLMNTLGAMIGYCVMDKLLKKHGKKSDTVSGVSLKHDSAELLIVVGSVFVSTVFIKYPIAEIVYRLPIFG